MIRQLFKLLLSLVLVGGIHISSSGDLRFGESLSAQSKKKKKSAKKKRSSRKKKPSTKKKSSRRKTSSKKKKAKSPSNASKPLPIVNKGPQINVAAFADELYQLSSELEASNNEMARATRFIYNDCLLYTSPSPRD